MYERCFVLLVQDSKHHSGTAALRRVAAKTLREFTPIRLRGSADVCFRDFDFGVRLTILITLPLNRLVRLNMFDMF